MRRFKYCFIILFCVSFLPLFSSCSSNVTPGDTEESVDPSNEILESPTNLNYDSKTAKISWDNVNGAVGYNIVYNGESYDTSDTYFDILNVFEPDKKYDVSICAIAKESKNNSDYSDSLYVTLESTEGLSYTLLDDGSGYSVSRGKINFLNMPEIIVIKDIYNGLPVLETKEESFGYVNMFNPNIENTTTKRVRLSKNTLVLNRSSFFKCTALEDIKLPQNLKEIRQSVFGGCLSLKKIELPDSLEKLGDAVFNNSGIVEMFVPNIEIGTGLVNRCKSLNTIIFDDEIKMIPETFCYGCDNLTTVILPKTLEKIGFEAFRECTSLVEIDIPESTTEIGEFAFYLCESLEFLTIPKNVEIIHSTSFALTKWLAKQEGVVVYNGIIIGYNIPENFDLIIPDNIKIISKSCFENNSNIKTLYIPSTVSGIENSAFRGCTNLEKVVIESIDTIPASCFQNCKNLKEVIVMNGLECISNAAFSGCEKLEKLDLPSSLKEINNGAFYGCKALKEFDFSNIEKLGSNAFFQCGIEKLHIESDIFDDTFRSENLTTVFVGKNVTNMPKFNYCSNLKEIFYEGTAEDYQKILRKDYEKNGTNNAVLTATIYYYSEEKPTEEGNYWHYVGGIPTPWN